MGIWTLYIPTRNTQGTFIRYCSFSIPKTNLGAWSSMGWTCVSSMIFLVGYGAAAAGMIEHIVFFIQIPVDFTIITFFENLLYALLFRQLPL